MSGKDHRNKALRYVVSSSPLLPRPSSAQISSSASNSRTPSAYIPHNDIIWLMRLACWITNNTHARARALRLCNTYCFSTATMVSWTSSSSVICHTTGPQPLPKRFLHLMQSRASSFKYSSVPKVIQQLLTSSSSSSCHFYLPLYLPFNNFF